MKIIILFACVFAAAMADDMEDMMQNMHTWAQECAKSLDMDEETMKEMHEKKEVPTEKPGSCFIACILEKGGLMEDKLLNGKAIEETVEAIATAKNIDQEKAKETSKKCMDAAKDMEDECEMASAFMTCIKKHHQMMEE